eukprot:COSAG05_NODE_38_length_27626_cov_78.614306_4_plen_154_part_00
MTDIYLHIDARMTRYKRAMEARAWTLLDAGLPSVAMKAAEVLLRIDREWEGALALLTRCHAFSILADMAAKEAADADRAALPPGGSVTSVTSEPAAGGAGAAQAAEAERQRRELMVAVGEAGYIIHRALSPPAGTICALPHRQCSQLRRAVSL